jgi:hypothetical protein
MRYEDLDLSTRPALIGLIIVFTAALFVRATIFFRRERAGINPQYPDSWNAKQRQILESFRLLIGPALIPLWPTHVLIRSSMPTSGPSGLLEVTWLISMLSLSYAWTLPLAARNWTRLDAVPRSFLPSIMFLLFWWGTTFSAIEWTFAAAAAPSLLHIIPPGVYAA